MSSNSASTWNKHIKKLRYRINLTSFLDEVKILFFCLCVLLGFGIYAMRRLEGNMVYLWGLSSVLFIGCLVAGILRSRKKWFREQDCRAYLDEQLGLNSQLCAAQERDMPVVPAPATIAKVYRRQSFLPFYWVFAGVFLLLLSFWLPLPASPLRDTDGIVSVPPALSKVEELINLLEEQESIDQDSVEPFKEDLADFLKKSKEEMYTHSGLEASDAMKTHVESAVMEFVKDIKDVGDAMGDIAAHMQSGAELDLSQLEQALQAMESAALSPDGELAAALANIDPSSIRELSAEQVKEMMERLKEAGECMNGMCQSMGLVSWEGYDFDQAGMVSVPMPGEGGVDRGRGDAPMFFHTNDSQPVEMQLERVESKDMDHLALGEQLGVTQGEHEQDQERKHAIESTGAASKPAKGGDAAWIDNVSPGEQGALRHIFD